MKYNNRVFWDNLWNPELLDFLGLVVNRMGDVIARQEYGNHLAVDDSDGAGGNPIETSDKGLI